MPSVFYVFGFHYISCIFIVIFILLSKEISVFRLDSRKSSGFGRFVQSTVTGANASACAIVIDQIPRVCLIATRLIQRGEEITLPADDTVSFLILFIYMGFFFGGGGMFLDMIFWVIVNIMPQLRWIFVCGYNKCFLWQICDPCGCCWLFLYSQYSKTAIGP